MRGWVPGFSPNGRRHAGTRATNEPGRLGAWPDRWWRDDESAQISCVVWRSGGRAALRLLAAAAAAAARLDVQERFVLVHEIGAIVGRSGGREACRGGRLRGGGRSARPLFDLCTG